MLHARNLFCFILLHLIIATPQINLHFTDWVSNNAVQYDCLHIAASIAEANVNHQIISYCMNEWSFKFDIQKIDFISNLTFAELSKENISSEQLYRWSAPIDVAERYQFYLNQLLTSDKLSMGKDVFYNCTLPRFGPMCQYQFDYHHPNHSSLNEIIYDFYHSYRYEPVNFTCYTHLECYRGPVPICLDWSEICDQRIDCLDGGVDEERCWQLEINNCQENEFRCINGQCIPLSFFRDDINVPDCLDGSDEVPGSYDKCDKDEPSFGCEDVTCAHTFWTSSCVKQRKNLLMETIFSIKDSSVSQDCWSAFKCILGAPNPEKSSCDKLCEERACVKTIEKTCPDMLYIPNVPLLFGHVYFAYTKNDSKYLNNRGFLLPYVCYNDSRYDDYFVNVSKVLFKNGTCFRPESLPVSWILSDSWELNYHAPLYELYKVLNKYNLILNNTSGICNRSNMYQCVNSSKCISIHRLLNSINDCPLMDDEDITIINNPDLVEQFKNHFKCETTNKYIPQYLVKNGRCDCGYGNYDWCEDEDLDVRYTRKNISFQTICDGFIELFPVTINRTNETDETECEQWQCDNTYTRCNGLWNCLNGADEVGCDISPPFNCSSDHRICVSPYTNQFMCLTIEKVNDGKVDCLGATDEPTTCRHSYLEWHSENFYCMNHSSISCLTDQQLCDNRDNCAHGDDEQFCNKTRETQMWGICSESYSSIRSDVEQFLCESMKGKTKQEIVHFSLDALTEDLTKNGHNTIFSSIEISRDFKPQCHRGLDLRVWLNSEKNLTTNTCLCPPSYYGDSCQYQNERVSLVIQFRALSDSWQIPFGIVISLINTDDARIIHSYEQFTYLSVRDCKIKFNLYLFYSTRPKNHTKHYAVHIDIYEKVSLTYRESLLFPLTFPFLPVHRLALIVDISGSSEKIKSCSDDQCIHGKCIKYSNNPKITSFCQCNRGWSGRYCTVPYTCMCSSDSICLGISANNRSICVCPIHRFGSRCLLANTVCQNSPCKNGGQCIPDDQYISLDQKFTCICSKGFTGDRCEIVDKKIVLSFEKDMIISSSIFIHFIEAIKNGPPRRTTTFRTIPINQNSITVFWPQPFHLVFIELLNKNYYLSGIEATYNRSDTMVETVSSSNRCPHINELFNKSIIELHPLRRIKYYHLPCHEYIYCFHDSIHICLCQNNGEHRWANCFEFNHKMKFDCSGETVCENEGQCFQDSPTCPSRSMCICNPCLHGTRCQFSTNIFDLSLDAILGYHIQPHIKIIHQPRIIQISAALIMILTVVGLINGILALITFRNKSIREVGCGLYLLGSSLTSIFTMIMFTLKFWILVLGQMSLIENRSFLYFQCISFDFLLRICLNMDQWLNAFVAVERAFTAMKSTRFNKKKSKQVAKWVIIFLLILTIVTTIHDPIYRRLIDEESDNEKRIWCIVTYPSHIRLFNTIVHTSHFIVPFLLNLSSVLVLIIEKTRQRSNIQTHQSYRQVLREQVFQHKNLFIAPIILVILALPRLMISYLSKCMESTDEPWLFLSGYLLSFIPPMLTFVIFIIPSKFYKQEFRRSLARYRSILQRLLNCIS